MRGGPDRLTLDVMRAAAVLVAVTSCTAAPPPRSPAVVVAPASVAPTPMAPPAAPDPSRVPFGPDQRAAELAVLRDALRDSYAHLETKQQQWGVDLDALYATYLPAIREAETWARYEYVMVAFVAELHDGHVQWRRRRGPSETKRRVVRLGLDTRFVGEALIVADVWPGSAVERGALQLGDRIVAIDGELIEQRLGGLASLRSWSRAEAARHDFARSWPAARAAVDVAPRARAITRELADGSYQTLSIVPETTPRAGGRPPAIEVTMRGDVAILCVRSLRGRVKDTIQQATAAATTILGQARGLVVDLRDNDGGFEDGALAIAARLSTRRLVAGSTRVRLSAAARAQQRAWRDLPEDPDRPGWSALMPLATDGLAARELPGRIAVVIDAGCRSSCETLALLLRAAGARLFGERTGGAGGAPITIELPRSKARVGIPARASYDPTGAPIEGRGVGPDELVVPTRADLAARRDVALERALDDVCPTRGGGRC